MPSTPPPSNGLRQKPRVLIVGMGGLGCPLARVLAQTAIAKLVLLDDDLVDESNLGRQILFDDADVGTPKIEAAARKLRTLGAASTDIIPLSGRLLPDSALQLASDVDLVIEGADNYATKFLAADAAFLAGRPVIHGAALGFVGTALAAGPRGGPCYRCVFEDVPTDEGANCSSHGIMGPVAGFVGAAMADLALAILSAQPRYGTCIRLDGHSGRVRATSLRGRETCTLCGSERSILSIEEPRYTRQICVERNF